MGPHTWRTAWSDHVVMTVTPSWAFEAATSMARVMPRSAIFSICVHAEQNRAKIKKMSLKRLKKVYFCMIYCPLFARASSLMSCRSSSAVHHPLSIHTLLQYLSLCPHHNRTLTPTHDTSSTRTRTNSDSTPLITTPTSTTCAAIGV